MYRVLMVELLDTLFTPAYLEPIISSLTDSILPYIPFGDSDQAELFEGEKVLMISFIKNRIQF
jgi:hypothetical protein